MKSATISDLKNKLSHYLRFVKNGEPVIVLERGIPVAEIRSRKAGMGDDSAWLNRLEQQGVIRQGKSGKISQFPYPSKGRTSGVLEALLDERRNGR